MTHIAGRPAARVWPERGTAPPLRAAGPAFGARVSDVIAELEHRVSYRQVDYWLHKFPDLLLDDPAQRHPPPGSGHQRTFTDVEFARLVRMGRLVLSGRQPAAAASAAAEPPPRDLALAWALDRGECT